MDQSERGSRSAATARGGRTDEGEEVINGHRKVQRREEQPYAPTTPSEQPEAVRDGGGSRSVALLLPPLGSLAVPPPHPLRWPAPGERGRWRGRGGGDDAGERETSEMVAARFSPHGEKVSSAVNVWLYRLTEKKKMTCSETKLRLMPPLRSQSFSETI